MCERNEGRGFERGKGEERGFRWSLFFCYFQPELWWDFQEGPQADSVNRDGQLWGLEGGRGIIYKRWLLGDRSPNF